MLIKAVTDSSKAMTQVIRESNHETFGEVRDKLNSIFDIVSRKKSKRTKMQDIPSISTEPWDRNVQVPPTVINAGNEEVHQLLRSI